MIIKNIKKCICIIAAIAVSLVILSAFALIYGYSGVHVNNPSGTTDYKWDGHQYKSTMNEGFAWLHLDNNGFNNTEAISPELVDAVIMGSSHMEAINVSSCENTVSVLNKMVPEIVFYNIGVSGHDIYQCAKNVHNVTYEYSSCRFIIIETDKVLLNRDRMESVLNGTLQTIPSYESGLLFYTQKYIPAVKSIYKQIQDWRNESKNNNSELSSNEELDSECLALFLEKIKEDSGDREIIIVYHPSTKIDENGGIILPNEESVQLFQQVCINNGIIFIDMTDDFVELFNQEHILAHGFTNTAVGTGHLNKYGHQVIAERLAQVIMEDK